MSLIFKKLNSKEKRSQTRHVLNPKENWIGRYVEISSHLCFRDFDRNWFDNLHFEIIRDLFDDSLDDDIVLHLLSLIELMFPMFDANEKVEETFVALLKLLQTNRKRRISKSLVNKHYQCATSMMLYFGKPILDDDNVSKLFADFIDILMKNVHDQRLNHYQTSLDCLKEIASCCPEMINLSKTNTMLKSKNLMEKFCLLPLLDKQGETEKIREIVQQLTFVPDIKFYHICNDIHQMIVSGRYGDSLSLLILRPFLSKFIFSNQIHNVHFALRLLIEFGFDIYTSLEEDLFLKQMVRTCTMPSLPVGHRLLLLSFIKIAFESIFLPPVNPPPLSLLKCLHPLLFDGPDTQEKKLLIMNQTTFVISDEDFHRMLINLHEKSKSDCRNYERATNSLFHIMNQLVKKRVQLTDRILQLLLDSFFNTHYLHYVKKFCLFWNEHKELGQKLTDNFIAKLMVLTKDHDVSNVENIKSTISSPKAYFVYLNFINWFLSVAHRNIKLTEFQLEFLINFIYRNSFHYTESSTLALQCCTSILYYQRVTPKVKGALLTLLEWLKNERKSDLEASSLAQIYLLALRTLAEESIKQVFTSDEEEFLLYQTPEMFEQYLFNVKNVSKECPVVVEQISSAKLNHQKQKYGSNLSKMLQFQVYLDSKSEFDRIFCVEIEFFANHQPLEHFSRIFQIACIEVGQEPINIDLCIDFLIKDALLMKISVKFVDYKANIYNFGQFDSMKIMFEDLLIPLDLDSAMDPKTVGRNLMMKHKDFAETVICIREHKSIDSFLEEFGWMRRFLLIDDDDVQDLHDTRSIQYLIGMAPDRIIMGTIQLINDFINIFMITNYFDVIPSFFFKFHNKNHFI